MDSKYILPLPNFEYDHQALFDVQHNHENYESNPHFKKINYDTGKEGLFWDLFKVKSPVIDAVTQKFKFKTDYKFTKILAGGVLPTHIDPYRTGVIMFPLTNDPSPIFYYDEDQIIFEHTYTGVTLINAKIKHGVPLISSDRIFFQVNSYLPWEDLVEMHSKNKLYEQ